MAWEMTPYEARSADSQYQDRLRTIITLGESAMDTPQGVPAKTCFGTLPPMVFDLANGAPLVTERRISFWRKAIAEIFAFINGARTTTELRKRGCSWWDEWATPEKCRSMGLEAGDLGPGSYGPVFHDFPRIVYENGKCVGTATFNQFAHLINQIREFPTLRTLRISNWIPYYIGRGGFQRAVVSPCHGDLMVRILGGKLHLTMVQRSADMPIGVPANMVQYAALTLALAHVCGYEPGRYTHLLLDAHVYANQIEVVTKMTAREPKRLPTLRLLNPPNDLFQFSPDNFQLEDYDPHPAITNIPVAV
ncbi:MAG: thymidylate synthase [Candidatus Vogelbacteria bacterium]|nr:thymidylate synthase [Candidatus Vogelbacteria bacterium]